ncbi:MAG: OadG family transporter subunit [Christensenellales bacterium]|jgi:Na+-transporting methylmalonyl-CoA/oxaloacetate decarboxylase gamma subunit
MMTVSDMIATGAEYMLIGVGVVFGVLALFYVVIKLMAKLWPSKEEES